MQRIAEELAAAVPATRTRTSASCVVPVKDELLGNTRVELLVLMGAAGGGAADRVREPGQPAALARGRPPRRDRRPRRARRDPRPPDPPADDRRALLAALGGALGLALAPRRHAR